MLQITLNKMTLKLGRNVFKLGQSYFELWRNDLEQNNLFPFEMMTSFVRLSSGRS